MPMPDISNMHEDYRNIRSFNISFNRVMIWLLNTFFAVERFLHCRKPNPALTTERRVLTSADGDRFSAIVMKPATAIGTLPVLLYYHGGAFALSWASLHQLACERYALEAQCMVILVDYRLGPRKPFPAGFQDCYAAYQWVLAEAQALGADASRIAVMGDSAGGALSAGVAQRALDEGGSICGQALIYPVLDSDCKTLSATQFDTTPVFNAESNRRMWRMYLKNVPAGLDPEYASPGHRKELAGLPQTYLETAEFDPLRDEGLEYAARLTSAGVNVDLNATSGTVHGYELAANNPSVEKSMRRRIEALRDFFSL